MNQNINFSYIGKLTEGLIRFKIGTCPRYKCGFIDIEGNVVIEPIYTNAQNFKNGYSCVKIGNWADGKWGVINKLGELVIDYKFNKIFSFSNNRAKVLINDRWGFINLNGEIVFYLDPYLKSTSFHNNFAKVHKYLIDKDVFVYGIIDIFGNEIVPCKIDCCAANSYFNCNEFEYFIDLYKSGFYDDFIVDD
jgi:hypothetical protein